jgi:hypothetical protein
MEFIFTILQLLSVSTELLEMADMDFIKLEVAL